MTLYLEDLTPLDHTEHRLCFIAFCGRCLRRSRWGLTRPHCPQCSGDYFSWYYLEDNPNNTYDEYHEAFIKLILNPALIAAKYDPLP